MSALLTSALALPAEPRPRVWPGLIVIVLQWIAILMPGWVAPGTITQFMGMIWGSLVAAAVIAVWWVFASRIRWTDRLLLLVVCAAIGIGACFLYHPSFHSEIPDNPDYLLLTGVFFLYRPSHLSLGPILFGLPTVTTAWVLWLLVTPFLRWPVRRAGLVVIFLLAWGCFALVRVEGIDASMRAYLHWRWSKTAEEQFLAELTARQQQSGPAPAGETLTLTLGDWPGFRGAKRDGRLEGVRIDTDWQQKPPRQVWKQRIGPGWSSFAVVRNRLYTQEQRGEGEAVVCADADTGRELWAHTDAGRFEEVVAGAGPRATPTFDDGKIYALGATGKLNCLDAATGRELWSRDIVADSGATLPTWGFASSPLVAQGVVTVFAGGPGGKSVLGYTITSKELVWSAGEGRLSYSSPHPAWLGGVEQVLIATDAGLTAFQPARGTVLWKHSWQTDTNLARVVQPAILDDSDVLLGTGINAGTRRLRLERDEDQWTDKTVWTTRAIKPYFNDLVVHEGFLSQCASHHVLSAVSDPMKTTLASMTPPWLPSPRPSESLAFANRS
jgi:outer membrane protein assembly factor BamB